MWKVDLERAYRQLRIDPLAYPLLGVRHGNKFYIDICPSFGCRVSGSSQQRVSESLCFLMGNRGHHVLAYVDDFGAAGTSREGAQQGFDTFNGLCHTLGLRVAEDKSAGPTQAMEWLGFNFDTREMTVTIPKAKLQSVLEEIKEWEGKTVAGRRELQSLVGKLAHISTCIRHARKFMCRLLAQLRGTPKFHKQRISIELRKDLKWWERCAAHLNTKQMLPLGWPTFDLECDACLKGGGGFSRDQYYDIPYPEEWSQLYHITQLEAINLIVAVKTLVSPELCNHVITIKTDNAASASVLVTGRSQDPVLAACSRELAMVVVLQQLEVEVVHVPGVSLVLADALSRRHVDPAMANRARELTDRYNLARVAPIHLDHVFTSEL